MMSPQRFRNKGKKKPFKDLKKELRKVPERRGGDENKGRFN